jgi:hypothetical protein
MRASWSALVRAATEDDNDDYLRSNRTRRNSSIIIISTSSPKQNLKCHLHRESSRFSHLSVLEEIDHRIRLPLCFQSGHPANILCFPEMLRPIDEHPPASGGLWLSLSIQ